MRNPDKSWHASHDEAKGEIGPSPYALNSGMYEMRNNIELGLPFMAKIGSKMRKKPKAKVKKKTIATSYGMELVDDN